MAFDPTTLITGFAGAGAVVAAAWLQRVGNKNRTVPEGVSLTKVIDDRISDFKQRVAELEAETRQLRDERDAARAARDQLLHENDYLNQRNSELGGP